MTALRATLQTLEQALASPRQLARPAELAPAAGAYASALAGLAARFEACRELVQHGRHDEARELARQEPDLRDALELLERFPAQRWRTAAEELGFDPGPELPCGRELLAALAAHPARPEALLRHHRRLALGRAPLAARLLAVRALVEAFPGDGGWRDDQAELERARQGELRQLAAQAEQARDAACLEQLLEEVRRSRWLAPPPQELASALERALAPLRQERALREAEGLCVGLREAGTRGDARLGRELLDRWDALSREGALAAPASLAGEVEAARAWVGRVEDLAAAEATFAADCASLEAALDEEADRPEVERLLARLERQERALPSVLGARVRARLGALTQRDLRRFRLRLAVSLLAVASLALVVAYGVRLRAAAGEARRWQAEMAGLLEEHDLAGARALLERLTAADPTQGSAPELQAMASRLEQEEARDRARRGRLDPLFATLEGAALGEPAVEDLLREAGELVETPEERRRLQRYADRRQELVEGQGRALAEELERELSRLETSLADARRTQLDGTLDPGALVALQAAARGLEARDGGGESLRRRITAVRAATDQLVEEVAAGAARARDQEASLSQLERMGSDPILLHRALREFLERFPSHPLAPELSRALELAPHVEGAVAWSRLRDEWPDGMHVMTQGAAERHAAALEELMAAHPAGAHLAAAREVAGYLAVARQALDSDGLRYAAGVRELMDQPLMTRLQSFEHAGLRWYVLRGGVAVQSAGRSHRVAQVQVLVAPPEESRLENFVLQSGDSAPKPKEAPHVPRARATRRVLLSAGEQHVWETVYLQLAELWRGALDVDPVLRALLVRTFLQFAAETTPFVGPEIRATLAPFLSLDLTVNWPDPRDEPAREARRLAARELERAAVVPELIRRVERRLAAPWQRLRPLGVYLGPERPFRAAPQGVPAALCVLRPAGVGASEWVDVGVVGPSGAQLVAEIARDLPAGTVVFARVP